MTLIQYKYNLRYIKSQLRANMQQSKYMQQHPQVSSNFIMISHTNLLSIQQQDSCKFCLQKGGEMISPCLCKGSLQFVHENCIKQWLKHQSENKNGFEEDIGGIRYQKCEICKYQIGFSYVTTKYCSCYSFFQRIKTKKDNLCSYLLALFVLLTSLGGLLYLLITSLMESDLPVIAIVTVVTFQTSFLICFLYGVVNCIFEYYISREILITRVLNKNKMVDGQ